MRLGKVINSKILFYDKQVTDEPAPVTANPFPFTLGQRLEVP